MTGTLQFRYKVLRQEDATEAYRQMELDVITGLQSQPKKLSSTYFYDDEGSGKLFGTLLKNNRKPFSQPCTSK